MTEFHAARKVIDKGEKEERAQYGTLQCSLCDVHLGREVSDYDHPLLLAMKR